MKLQVKLRPTAWIAITIGFTHFVVTMLEAQSVFWFLGGWQRDIAGLLWFPVSLFVDPTEITVPMHYFPLLGAWLSSLVLCAVSSAWCFYAYLIGRMTTSRSRLNRQLVAAWGVYAGASIGVLFLPIDFPALLIILSMVGILGALEVLVLALIADDLKAWPGGIFIAANMGVCAWFNYMLWGLAGV